MRYCRPVLIVALIALGAAIHWPALGLDPGSNPHEITNQPPVASCEVCHAENPGTYLKSSSQGIVPDWKAYKLDGTAICVQCHDAENAGHEVDSLVIDFPVPADLPLTSDQALLCMTCHYVHGSLKSNRPWASVSFMDRLLNDERLHKSYLLRRNNSNGELCLVCHDANGEKEND